MSLEAWTALAQIGTFVVIAATAIAAMLQLRHMQSANKVSALQTFASGYEGQELRDAFHFVRAELAERLKDPQFRHEIRNGNLDRSKHPETRVCNFFDQWGLYYRDGVIDKRSFMRVNAGVVVNFWERLEPVVALAADPVKGNTAYQQFEYLTLQARRWLAENPSGDYPKHEPRIPIVDPWRDADAPSAR